jgi:hypothetical protein
VNVKVSGAAVSTSQLRTPSSWANVSTPLPQPREERRRHVEHRLGEVDHRDVRLRMRHPPVRRDRGDDAVLRAATAEVVAEDDLDRRDGSHPVEAVRGRDDRARRDQRAAAAPAADPGGVVGRELHPDGLEVLLEGHRVSPDDRERRSEERPHGASDWNGAPAEPRRRLFTPIRRRPDRIAAGAGAEVASRGPRAPYWRPSGGCP